MLQASSDMWNEAFETLFFIHEPKMNLRSRNTFNAPRQLTGPCPWCGNANVQRNKCGAIDSNHMRVCVFKKNINVAEFVVGLLQVLSLSFSLSLARL